MYVVKKSPGSGIWLSWHRATGEDPLQLLRVDLRLDKDATADKAVLGIDQTAGICRHATLLCYCLALFAISR
jgi:hypothetical protein